MEITQHAPPAAIAAGAVIGAVAVPSAYLFARYGARPAPPTMFRGTPTMAVGGAVLGVGAALLVGHAAPREQLDRASRAALVGAGVGGGALAAASLLLPATAAAGQMDWRTRAVLGLCATGVLAGAAIGSSFALG